MSDRLKQSLMSSRSEIEAGLAEAEAELARVRQRALELQELIALGTAILLGAEMMSSGAKGVAAAGGPVPGVAGGAAASVDELAAAHERSKDELQSRLPKAQQK